MEIIIDGVDFWNLEAMRYFSFPKKFTISERKQKAKDFCMSGDFYASRKIDGSWNMIIKDSDGNYHMRSRTESVNGGWVDKAEWIPWITAELEGIPNGTALIGEIYFPNNEGSRKITSVLNCLKDKCIERQNKSGHLHFYIFDVVAYANKNIMDYTFEQRKNIMANIELDDLSPNGTHVHVADYKCGEPVWDMYNDILHKGGEGIVLIRKDCTYMPGKRTAWMTLKLKKELQDTIDAFYTGEYKPSSREYKGKEVETWKYWENVRTNEISFENKFNEFVNGGPWEPVTKGYAYGWASAIQFAVLRDGEIYPIAWISNIPEVIKAGVVEHSENYVGKVAALTAMEIENVTGTYAMRHGKIECWRDDKQAKDCGFDQIGVE